MSYLEKFDRINDLCSIISMKIFGFSVIHLLLKIWPKTGRYYLNNWQIFPNYFIDISPMKTPKRFHSVRFTNSNQNLRKKVSAKFRLFYWKVWFFIWKLYWNFCTALCAYISSICHLRHLFFYHFLPFSIQNHFVLAAYCDQCDIRAIRCTFNSTILVTNA